MEKWEKAQKLLQEKINKCDFKDEVYTLVDDIISDNIIEVEKELDMNESDILDDDVPLYDELKEDIIEKELDMSDNDILDNDDVAWYDELKEDMRQVLYERISKWLSKDN